MSEEWREFDLAVARWRRDGSQVLQLPPAAMAALIAGADTPTLPRLTAEAGGDPLKIEALLRDVLAERGRSIPSLDESLKLLSDDLLRAIIAEPTRPERALHELSEFLRDRFFAGDCSDDVTELMQLYYSWDDWYEYSRSSLPEDAPTADDVRRDIVGVAATMLARGGIKLGRD